MVYSSKTVINICIILIIIYYKMKLCNLSQNVQATKHCVYHNPPTSKNNNKLYCIQKKECKKEW